MLKHWTKVGPRASILKYCTKVGLWPRAWILKFLANVGLGPRYLSRAKASILKYWG